MKKNRQYSIGANCGTFVGVMRLNQEWRSNHDDIQIGNDVIVGAQSVVIKDVSPYAVVGGTPGWFIT
jgi:hypothetical protein